MIGFRLDARSNVVPYLQLVEQVRAGTSYRTARNRRPAANGSRRCPRAGDQPDTVLKAYRELQLEGLVDGRPGQGTFVLRSLAGPSLANQAGLRRELLGVVASRSPSRARRRRHRRADPDHGSRSRRRGRCVSSGSTRARCGRAVSASGTGEPGTPRLFTRPARRSHRRARGAERCGQDHAAQPRGRAASADHGICSDPWRRSDAGPGAARARRLRRAGHAAVIRTSPLASWSHSDAEPNAGFDERLALDRLRQLDPHRPSRRDPLGRSTGAGGARDRPREAAVAPAARRAGGEPRPARPTRVPPGPRRKRGRGGTHRAWCSPRTCWPTSSDCATT